MTESQALEKIEEAKESGELLPAIVKAPITPAQAKIDAVANLTMKAYERASTLELKAEEIAALQADFPDEAFQPGAAGKENLLYIEHAHLRDRLNQVFGPGQWSIIPRNRWAEDFTTPKGTEASRVYVEAMLCIRGCFVAEAVGDMVYYKNNDSQNYGDAVEGAKTAALRRCAKELGIGLQAWKKAWCDGWWARKRGGKLPAPTKPANVPQKDELERITDDLMQMRQRSETWPTDLSGVPPNLYERAKILTFQQYESRAACKDELSKLLQCFVEAGQTRENALRSLRRCTGTNSSSRLQQSASGSMAGQGASSASTQTVSKSSVKPAPQATEKTRAWFLAEMRKRFSDATLLQWAMDHTDPVYLMPQGETLEDWPLTLTPTSKEALQKMIRECAEFTGVEPVQQPAGATAPASTSAAPASGASQGHVAPKKTVFGGEPDQQPWFRAVVPVPYKGQKRDEYLKRPDTIGELYNLRHDDDQARRRLFGFLANFEPKGWTNQQGRQMPPSDSDKKFRADLDAFGDWFADNHPDESKD